MSRTFNSCAPLCRKQGFRLGAWIALSGPAPLAVSAGGGDSVGVPGPLDGPGRKIKMHEMASG